MIGLHRLFPDSRVFAKYYEGHLPENKTNPVDVLSGAFMMLSKNALKKVNGFDEDYFMYGEDIDLSCRIIESGYKNYYFPDTTITHYKGKSTPYHSACYTKHFYDAMKIFTKKYLNDNKLKMGFVLWGIECSRAIANINRFFKRLFIN